MVEIIADCFYKSKVAFSSLTKTILTDWIIDIEVERSVGEDDAAVVGVDVN
jgi:hypothetical protein